METGEGPPLDCGALPISPEGGALTSIAPLEFDAFDVEVGHKRDIDPVEDGCVNAVDPTLRRGSGCELTVHAGGSIDGDALTVYSVALAADSQCPGFTDAQEGLYDGGRERCYFWRGLLTRHASPARGSRRR